MENADKINMQKTPKIPKNFDDSATAPTPQFTYAGTKRRYTQAITYTHNPDLAPTSLQSLHNPRSSLYHSPNALEPIWP
ncbi:unnamed protein product [Moneuplotes crassus]|uniref:Uncharacterized protein n=1 Tax=Euplotes crassus TaxID=5936 RepID=A0AAD1XEK6_EUPCR|nr:unnamed protein product [Moneuplotes crassus]